MCRQRGRIKLYQGVDFPRRQTDAKELLPGEQIGQGDRQKAAAGVPATGVQIEEERPERPAPGRDRQRDQFRRHLAGGRDRGQMLTPGRTISFAPAEGKLLFGMRNQFARQATIKFSFSSRAAATWARNQPTRA